MPYICQRFVKDMPKILQRYTKDKWRKWGAWGEWGGGESSMRDSRINEGGGGGWGDWGVGGGRENSVTSLPTKRKYSKIWKTRTPSAGPLTCHTLRSQGGMVNFFTNWMRKSKISNIVKLHIREDKEDKQ